VLSARRRDADGGEFARRPLEDRRPGGPSSRPSAPPDLKGGWVLAAADPLSALQSLAHAWRRELGARVLASPARPGRPREGHRGRDLGERVHASLENFNTDRVCR